MRSSLRYFLIAMALLAGGIFIACGSDSDDNGDGDAGEPAADQPVDGDRGDDDSSIDASDELRQLTEQFGVSELRIVYEMSGNPGGLELNGQMTLYIKPPDLFRTDIDTEFGGVIFIGRDGAFYSCVGGEGAGQCVEIPGSEDIFGSPISFKDPGDLIESSGIPLDGGDITRSSREIAGQDATCYSAAGDDGGEVCISDNGVPLLIVESSGEFRLDAIEVSDSVADSDFELPYEVFDIGDLIP